MSKIWLAAIVTIASMLSACATTELSSVGASGIERSVAWDKVRTFAEAEAICKNVGEYAGVRNPRSCHYFTENVCRVVTVDIESEFESFGEAFSKCYKDDPSKDSALLAGFVKSTNKKIRPVTWRSEYAQTADSMCRKVVGDVHWKHVNGCYYYENGYILITSKGRPDSPKTENAVLGHEAKHVFDGAWHEISGVPKSGAFIGVQ